jgi:hypothetical protein
MEPENQLVSKKAVKDWVLDHEKAYPWAVLKASKSSGLHRTHYIAVTSTHIRCFGETCFKAKSGLTLEANKAEWRAYQTKATRVLANKVIHGSGKAWKKTQCETLTGDAKKACRKDAVIPIVMMGDFNSRYERGYGINPAEALAGSADPIRNITGKGFTDSRLEVHQDEGYRPTDRRDDLCWNTYATRNVVYDHTAIYDYIFYRWKSDAGGLPVGVKQKRLHTELDTKWASDHRMIWTTVQFINPS